MAKRKRSGYTPKGGPRKGHAGTAASRRPDPAPALPAVDIVAIAAAVLIALTPLFRGLYFPSQQLWALIAAAFVAGAVWLVRPWFDRRLSRGWLDWAVYALPGAYLLSTFVAVDYDTAIQSLLLHLLYALIFFSAAEVALASPRARQIIWHGVLGAALVVALTGLAGAAGLATKLSWFPPANYRMYTSIQYPDAAAAYLAAGFFVAAGLLLSTQNLWARLGYRIAAAALLLTFVATLSRGATLAFLPALAVFIVVLGPGRRTEGWGAVVGTGLAAAVAGVPYLAHLHRTHAAPPGMVPVLETVALLLVVGAAVELGWGRLRATARSWTVGGLGALVVLGGGAAAAYKIQEHAAGALGRLARLGIYASYSAWSRIDWWGNAMKMVGARPILGWGGGGWAAAYQAFQSYDYSSTQVHNGWLQLWVSTGTVGFLIWLAVWVLLALAAWTAYRRLPATDRPRLAGLVAAITMLGAHGFIDFTLALGSISIGLWAMAGLLRSEALTPVPEPEARRSRRVPVPPSAWPAVGLYAVLCGALLLGSLRLAANGAFARASTLAQQGNLRQSLSRLASTVGADPWLSNAWDVSGQLLLTEAQSANPSQVSAATIRQLYSQAGSDFARAVRLSPYNFLWREGYAQYLQFVSNNPAAITQLQAGLRDHPFSTSLYQAMGVARVRQAIADIQSGKTTAARSQLAAIPPLAAQRVALAHGIPARALQESKLKPGEVPPVTLTVSGLQLALGESEAIQGQWSAAQKTLQPLAGSSGQLAGEASLWLGLVAKQLGQSDTADLAAAKTGLGSSTYNSEYGTATGVLGKLSG